MDWYYIVLIIIVSIILLVLLTCYICFRMCFYSNVKVKENGDINLPNDEIYQTHKELITKDIMDARKMNYKKVSIKSYDGLTLVGKYYENFKDATIEIMFHGYRGSGERDLSTGIRRAKECGRNALIIEQRAGGYSEGHVITFGVKERYDVISWINYVIETFGKDVKIILTGISMGAATVVNASAFDLPNNVIGILADCGYDSAKEMIKKTIREMKLPDKLLYPFVKLSAKIYGGFNLEEISPIEAIKKCKVPIIFIHGDADNLVPCYMSENLYDACNSKKQIVKINNAGHGISYLIDPITYVNSLNEFFK